MAFKRQIVSLMTRRAVHYLEHNPEKHFDNLIKIGRTITKNKDPFFRRAVNIFDDLWRDEDGPWRSYLIKYLTELDRKQRQKFAVNFLINGSLMGCETQEKCSQKYGCNIPWAILMDPTSACNLKCTGCWAAEYKKQDNLTLNDMEDVINQGKRIGCYIYLFSGGEPLIRKNDILSLCAAHQDCIFAAFTNGTLIDEDFAAGMKQYGNFFPIISIEGFEEQTDMRRGEGTFKKVVNTMDLLKKNKLAFGFSCCYHNFNVDVVSSDEFIDFMIDKGAWFGWYFTYIPVGSDAHLEFMVNPEQRAMMYERIREIRSKKPLFVLDFWNDGEYVNGCIAGGRRYFHINSAGEAEPCAFIHYANSNIHNTKILDILRSPLFIEYYNGQPFNENMLRPCPLLDNPEKLKNMVKTSKAHSTQGIDSEDVETLTDKCVQPAADWAVKADGIWYKDHCKGCGKCSKL